MKAPTTHIYEAGLIERPDGKGSYRWVDGYASLGETGCAQYPWRTFEEMMRDYGRVTVHATQREAYAARMLEASGLKEKR